MTRFSLALECPNIHWFLSTKSVYPKTFSPPELFQWVLNSSPLHAEAEDRSLIHDAFLKALTV